MLMLLPEFVLFVIIIVKLVLELNIMNVPLVTKTNSYISLNVRMNVQMDIMLITIIVTVKLVLVIV